MDISNRPTRGEVKEVSCDEGTARFQWTIPDFVKFPPGRYYAPALNCFNTKWYLEIHKYRYTISSVSLHRAPGMAEPVRFTIGYQKAGDDEVDMVRDQTFPEDFEKWRRVINYWLYRTTSSGDLTITCTLRKGGSRGAETTRRIGVPEY